MLVLPYRLVMTSGINAPYYAELMCIIIMLFVSPHARCGGPFCSLEGDATRHPWVAAQDAIVMDLNLSPSNSSQSRSPPSVS
jgi:hypothetical protein